MKQTAARHVALAAACLTLSGWLPAAAAPEPIVIESSLERVALLELFTSEGCSSCPPADRWLSSLTADPRLWRELVPVAFHVDYWDYLGWKDRFARRAHSERQRRFAEEGAVRAVYTPGLVLNGREWRSWFHRRALDLGDAETVGRLRLQVQRMPDASTAHLAFTPLASRTASGPLEAHVALLGFGLETAVKGGENEGRTLAHDFVVLEHVRAPMTGAGALREAVVSLPRPSTPSSRYAVTAWVSAAGDQRPLQAVGGWLPD